MQTLLSKKDQQILYANKENNHRFGDFLNKNISSKTDKKSKYLKSQGCKGWSLQLPPKLEEFYCRHSMLRFDIPGIEVCPNNSLRRFVLNHNALNKWHGPLKGLNELEYIDLSVNLCDNTSDNLFIHLSSLKYVHVGANFIGYVIEDREEENPNGHPCPWLKPLTNLVSLDLYLNKIKKLPRKCFFTRRNLETLILEDNSLSDWELEIQHMPYISLIDLSGNNIDRLPEDTMDHLSEVSNHRNVTVNLYDNELECVFKNIDFLEWLDTANIDFIYRDTYMCRNKDWEKFNMTNIKQVIADLKKNCADYVFLNTVLSVLIGCFALTVLYGIYNQYKWKLKECAVFI